MRFFTWEAACGRILTTNQLQKRSLALANRCYRCLQCKESVDHLLLPCAKTRLLRELLFSLLGTTWVISGSLKDTLELGQL